MCGIYGIMALAPADLRFPEMLERMGGKLRHRGPDGHATLVDQRSGLGTERLRIIDLHERADQPFSSPDGDIWLACNGEIYNSKEIRARYPDYPYRSGSDVETIIPLFLDKGIDGIQELDGMFGIAIRDRRDGRVILARDRAGEKPLFYARVEGEIVFASEMQCLLEDPAIPRDLDDAAIGEYLRLGYVPEPRTMFRAIRRIGAGTCVVFSGDTEETHRYWDPLSFPITPIDPREAVDTLQSLVERAIEKQVTSDVPVGVFISGGLDSSILAMLAAKTIGADEVHTFSARFAEESYDESSAAEVLATRLGTRHVPVPIDDVTLPEALAAVVSSVADPIADPAILPTYLLARAARKHVTVILSGEGADELFGGYPTYIGHKVAPWYDALPSVVRKGIRKAVMALPTSSKKVTVEFLLKRFVAAAEDHWTERHFRWFGSGLGTEIFNGTPTSLEQLSAGLENRSPLEGAMLLDYTTYLRDNLLVKVDRATMLSSVEARAPFLDRDVTRFALSLPPSLRVHGFTTKWVLKEAARQWLPAEVIDQRKRGLSVPVASWLNRGLRGEVDRLLSSANLQRLPMVNSAYVAQLVAEHRSGAANHARPLWTLLMLQYWLERWAN